MNGIPKRILVGFTALVLAPLAALQAGEAVKVAVVPELAGVMREIIGATAERPVVSGQFIVWRPGYQKLQPPPPECEVIVTGSDSEMDALVRHGQVIAGSRAVIAEAELMLYVAAASAKNIRHVRDLARADVSVAVAAPESSWLGEASDMLLSRLGVSRTGAERALGWRGGWTGRGARRQSGRRALLECTALRVRGAASHRITGGLAAGNAGCGCVVASRPEVGRSQTTAGFPGKRGGTRAIPASGLQSTERFGGRTRLHAHCLAARSGALRTGGAFDGLILPTATRAVSGRRLRQG